MYIYQEYFEKNKAKCNFTSQYYNSVNYLKPVLQGGKWSVRQMH